MEDFSNRSVCVVEQGTIFQSWAHRLSRDFGKTYYYRSKHSPIASDQEPGMGYEDIELVNNWEDVIDKVDLWVFVDIYNGAMQEHLAGLGKRVFGARRGDELEIWRSDFRRLMRKLKMPMPEYESVTGIDALREHLSKVENKFVKTASNIRGTTETWKHIRHELSQGKLKWLDNKLGALRDSQEFLIETPIEDVEVGYDDMCIRGQFADSALVGVEIKGEAYAGQFMEYYKMPENIRYVNEKLSPVLEEFDYRGLWSTELRGDVLLDPCCRAPSPAGECEQEVYANLAERMWYGAEGLVVDPIPVAKYAVEAVMFSQEAETEPLPIYVAQEAAQWVKLYSSAKDRAGQEWIAPQNQMREIGAVVGLGDSLDEAEANCRKNSEGVECMGLKINLEKIAEAWEGLREATTNHDTARIAA